MTENPHENYALPIPQKKWSLVTMQVKHIRHSCDGQLAISWGLPLILKKKKKEFRAQFCEQLENK